MNFYDRYISGEDGRLVYADIYSLGQKAFNEDIYIDVQKVLTETFQRVAFNLGIIFTELTSLDYAFKKDIKYNFQEPFLKPLPDTEMLLLKLDESVKDFGFVPYSLKLFYKIVGSCNFGWDYETQPNLRWHYADPIQISSLDSIISEITDEYWKETLTEIINEGDLPNLELAPDSFHKDNVSGGLAYAIQITKEPSIDGLFLNEPNSTTFINYLRICMENCGFPGITNPRYGNDYEVFFAKVKPLLKKI